MEAESLPSAEQLIADAALLNVPLDAAQADQLLDFGRALLRWNRAFNLISRKDEDRLYHRHLLDSLSVLPSLSGARVLDVGSGPGLPGVPLAIAGPSRRFQLIDRSARRMRFVDQAARSLKLGNVVTGCGDVQTLAAEPFDTVVMRAVVDAAEAWALAGHLVATGGRMVIMASGQTPGAASRPWHDAAGSVRGSKVVGQRLSVRIPGLPVAHQIQILSRLGNESTAAAPEPERAESQTAEQDR
jgi:16S rRNA (guanine527-N7)-methyltransferase